MNRFKSNDPFYNISYWLVGGLSLAWTIAMITLWEWNVNGTGMWFAILMIALGVLVFTINLMHYFGKGKKIGDFLRRYVFYRKDYKNKK